MAVLLRVIVQASLLLFSCTLFADQGAASKRSVDAEQSAKQFVSEVISALEARLLSALEENKLNDESYLDSLINAQVFPYIDMSHITKKVTGPHWDEVLKSNDELAMQQAIKATLLRTYRVALASYDGDRIIVGESKDKAKYSLVRVSITSGTSQHHLDFAVKPKGDSWLIFDVSIDGVVFTKTMRSSVAPMFEKQNVKEVIKNLLKE